MARHAHFLFYSSSEPLQLKKEEKNLDISTGLKRPVLTQRFYSVIVQLPSTSCL